MKNEPAFPTQANAQPIRDENGRVVAVSSTEFFHTGISKRDYFAARALQGLILRRWEDNDGNIPNNIFEVWAKSSFECADAMIAESEKEQKP